MLKYFLFSFFCVLTYASSPKILSFTSSPIGKFQPRQREKLQLVCRTLFTTKVEFRKDGKLLARTVDGRMIQRGNTLSITNLDYAKDDGSYRCIAINNKGSVLSIAIDIKIAVLGQFQFPGRLTDPEKKEEVIIGKAFQLPCPSYTYSYPRNVLWGNAPTSGQPRLLSENQRRFKLSNGDLFFTNVEFGDINEINVQLGGVSCFLYHNGPFKQSVRHKLTNAGTWTSDVAPIIKEGISTTNRVKTGAEFSFYCSGAGKPTPSITWYQPDGRVISATDTAYTISPTKNRLTIRSVFQRYAGSYRCEVTNRAGKASTQGNLVVEDPPSWRTELRDKTVEERRNASFSCRSAGSGIITYTWLKNGNLIDRTNSSYTVNGGLLNIKNIGRNDFGMVQCFAKNEHGEIASSAFLNVRGSVIPTNRPGEGDEDKLHFGYYVLIGGGCLTVFAISSFVIYHFLH
ncbi:contactin-2-like [Hydractinia symbiolongicarpus]|uniref:contactin-2-like n=1 Tax=Hydractinia symbiolongicarpus TaxID=13093 RepID=UPI00254C3298|nr:contactin-2-like [Hydractinia symbiolongicarpus]